MTTNKDEQKFSLSGTVKTGRDYLETRLKLFQLKLTERSSRLIANLLVDLIKIVFALFVVFFLSLALGFYLSELLGSAALGFLATGGFFALLILVLMVFEIRLERVFLNLSIKRFLQRWMDETPLEDAAEDAAIEDKKKDEDENRVQGT